MKNQFFLLALIVILSSCKQSSDLSMTPSTDQFSFYFTAELPSFVSINDNSTGALIATIQPVPEIEYVLQIPLIHKAESYNVNFIYDTRQSYFNGPVQVESFRDVKPTDYRLQEIENYPVYSYKSVQYSPADMIDTAHQGLGTYFKDGKTEFLIKENEPAISSVFIKLKNEDEYRYHYIENLNNFSETEISIEDLPIVPEVKKVTLADDIGTGGIRMYVKQPSIKNWRMMGNYYGKHIEDRSISIPITGNNLFIVEGHYFAADNSYYGSFRNEGIPEMLQPISFNYNLINEELDHFEIEGVDADIISYSFALTDNSQWNFTDDVSNGTDLSRPIFSDLVLEQFPTLGQETKLTNCTFTYLSADNSLNYQEIIKPRRRVLGYGFEFLNAYEGNGPIPFYQSISINF